MAGWTVNLWMVCVDGAVAWAGGLVVLFQLSRLRSHRLWQPLQSFPIEDKGEPRWRFVVLAKRYFSRYYGVPWYNGASEWVTMRIDGDQRQGGRGGLSSWEW